MIFDDTSCPSRRTRPSSYINRADFWRARRRAWRLAISSTLTAGEPFQTSLRAIAQRAADALRSLRLGTTIRVRHGVDLHEEFDQVSDTAVTVFIRGRGRETGNTRHR